MFCTGQVTLYEFHGPLSDDRANQSQGGHRLSRNDSLNQGYDRYHSKCPSSRNTAAAYGPSRGREDLVQGIPVSKGESPSDARAEIIASIAQAWRSVNSTLAKDARI